MKLLAPKERLEIVKKQGRCKFWDDDCPVVIGGVANSCQSQLDADLKDLQAEREKIVKGIEKSGAVTPCTDANDYTTYVPLFETEFGQELKQKILRGEV